ncbi:MAG: toll/interleukin-1 receptor domain-containing protein [Methylobacter sp.]
MIEFDVFISHNTKDKPIVRELIKKLNDRRLRIWFDDEMIIPGDSIQDKLEEGIEYSRAALVLVGKEGLGPWEKREVNALLQDAANKYKRIIPVLLPGNYEQPKLPLFLRDCHYVDFRKGLDTNNFEKLVKGITRNKPHIRSTVFHKKLMSSNTGAYSVDTIGLNSSSFSLFKKSVHWLDVFAKPKIVFWSILTLAFILIFALQELTINLSIGNTANEVNNKNSENSRLVTLNADSKKTQVLIHIDGADPTPCSYPCKFYAPFGALVYWEAKRKGYQSKSGSFRVNVENTRDIDLEPRSGSNL